MSNENHMRYKYLDVLCMLYITIILVTIIMAYKTLSIGSFILPGGILVFPLSYFLMDMISEIYGYTFAKRLIIISLVCQVLFVLLLTGINKMPSPNFWHYQTGYDEVISPLFRCIISINIGVTLGAWINSYCITKWRVLLKGKYFWMRSIGSSIVGETVLSIITFSTAFWGVIPTDSLINLIISAWTFKVIYAFFMATIGTKYVYFLARIENSPSLHPRVENPLKENRVQK